jgi:chromosome segregation ATPase
MDPGTISAVLTALGAGLILRQVVTFLLGRGKVRVDQAYQIREELRDEITRKNREIDTLDRRIDALEVELEKAEQGRANTELKYRTYKLDVYRTLLEAGVDRQILNTVLAIQ